MSPAMQLPLSPNATSLGLDSNWLRRSIYLEGGLTSKRISFWSVPLKLPGSFCN